MNMGRTPRSAKTLAVETKVSEGTIPSSPSGYRTGPQPLQGHACTKGSTMLLNVQHFFQQLVACLCG